MAQHLPDDIWSQLAETWLDKKNLQTISSTSRRMHKLVVPALFRRLQFHITGANPGSLTVVRPIKQFVRARSLFNSPELLRHTRIFVFQEGAYAVDSIARYLAFHHGLYISSWRANAENFLAVLHDAIFRLIFRMPGLREIEIGNSVMSTLCYAAISSRPLLTSLRLRPKRVQDTDNITHVIQTLPRALRLRDLEYYYSREHPIGPYLTDILDHCILHLGQLTVSSRQLPLVVSCIPSHHMLSLRALSVRFPDYTKSPNSLDVAALSQVLRACHELRHLSLRWKSPDVEPIHYLPTPNLPNLSTFSGPCRLLQIVSGGTSLVEIRIQDDYHAQDQFLTQVIKSPPAHLRILSMRRVIFPTETPHEILTFIRSLAVFLKLERLDIIYKDCVQWRNRVSAQDSHSTIKELLDQLACLRFLLIRSWYGAVIGYDIGCPISKEGEPADRGHATLEGIYVDFICNKWSWNSRRGWEERNWTII